MKTKLALLTLLCCAACRHAAPAPAQEEAVTDPLAQARADVADLYAGRTDRLWDRSSPAFRSALGGKGPLEAVAASVTRDLGGEAEVLGEQVQPQPGGVAVYTRTVRYARQPNAFVVVEALDAQGRIAGFGVRPAQQEAPSRHLDYRTRAELHLPFRGTWTVFWGGRDLEHNRHAMVSNQRFALDLLMVRDGKTHAGDGARNRDYFCFGQPVLAPADGVVVEAEDGRPDNAPGQMPTEKPLGNHVVLDLGHGEFAFLAHLQQGTVKVKPGQRVARGEELGLTGNSGHSSEPHLHFHLQDSADFSKGAGLPAQFVNHRADGKPVARGELEKGQQVEAEPISG